VELYLHFPICLRDKVLYICQPDEVIFKLKKLRCFSLLLMLHESSEFKLTGLFSLVVGKYAAVLIALSPCPLRVCLCTQKYKRLFTDRYKFDHTPSSKHVCRSIRKILPLIKKLKALYLLYFMYLCIKLGFSYSAFVK
jgi:hypothetical protein